MSTIFIRFLPYIIGLIALAGGYLYAYFQGKSACQNEQTEQLIVNIQESRNIERKLQSAVSDIDSRQIKIRELEHENSELRRTVDAGNKRLYVAAKCPPAMPSASDGSGLGDGGAAELNPESRQDYFDLRSGIEKQREQLIACQNILTVEREIFRAAE